MKRILTVIWALLLCLCTACTPQTGTPEGKPPVYRGENYRVELETARGEYLYGMMYLAYEGHTLNGVDYQKGMTLMRNMGVKMLRLDFPAAQLFPTPDTRDEAAIALYHQMIACARENGIEPIATFSGSYFHDIKSWYGYGVSVPRRNTADGSYYQIWLENYRNNWFRAGQEFPEIELWEMGNEPNDAAVYLDGSVGTLKERAEIYVDEMYAASCGLHEADADKVTIMGAITEPEGLGKSKDTTDGTTFAQWGEYRDQGRAIAFLNYVYDAIDAQGPSPYYDDYFQCAAWHPYTFTSFDADHFVAENDKIYNTIKTREGKNKRVYLTEFGFSDGMQHKLDPTTAQDVIADWTVAMYQTVGDRMPYVESVCWFRAFNDTRDQSWWGNSEIVRYGMFYDPNPSEEYPDYLPSTDTLATPGAPKPVAYAYQTAAGGTGRLTIMQSE